LVEVLVVIALISLLIAILIPSLKRSLRLAGSAVCMSNLQQVYQGLWHYRFDNDGWLPVVDETDPNLPNQSTWFVRMFPDYLSDLGSLRCPEDPFGFRLSQAASPSELPDLLDASSYGLSGFIVRQSGGYLASERFTPTRPLDTILVADLGPDVAVPSHDSDLPVAVPPPRNRSVMRWDDSYDPYEPEPEHSWLTERHNGRMNVVSMGGQVREVPTAPIKNRPMLRIYRDCKGAGCTLCNELSLPHYSFSHARLYWWTGPMPSD
jgi:type II secretory pathway pseudopilin PulG